MKKEKRLWLVMSLLGIGVYQAGAAVISWSGASSATFSTGANWVGNVAPQNSISTDTAQFSSTTSGRMPNVTANRSIKGMSFDSRDWTLNSTAGVILKVGGSGVTVASQRTVSFETLITAINNQSWTTTGSAVLNVNKAVSGINTISKVSTGTMNINAGFSTGGLNVTAGSVVLGASDLLGDSMALTGTAGTLSLNGFSDTVGTLGLAGDFVINLGASSGANSLSFADSSALNWGANTFFINSYEEGVDSLRFGTSSSGLTQDQLNNIQFAGKDLGAKIDGNGFVTAIPEPATIGLFGLGTLTAMFLRRKMG